MKKRWILCSTVLCCFLAALLCACDEIAGIGGSGDGDTVAPVVTNVKVLRKESTYEEEGCLPCVLADEDSGAIETVTMTVSLDNPKKYVVQSLRVNGRNYVSSEIRNVNAETVTVDLKESLPAKINDYQVTPETYDFKLETVYYRVGAKTFSVSRYEKQTVTVRINPTFKLTLDISETGREDKSDLVFEVPFMGQLSMIPNVGQMNPSQSEVAEGSNVYGKIGYGFLGWYTSNDETGTQSSTIYTSYDKYERFSDLKLYARYERLFRYEVEKGEDGEEYAVLMGLNSSVKDRAYLIVPKEIDGYPIRVLGADSFRNAANVSYIAFEADIVEIGDRAFMNLTSLGSFSLPDSCERIGSYAFAGCTKIGGRQNLGSVKEIGDYAFRGIKGWDTQAPLTIGASQMTLYLPSTVEKIGKGAFSETQFEKVWFSSECVLDEDSGADIFRNCKELRTVIFGVKETQWSVQTETGIPYIPEGMFLGCEKLQTPVLKEGLTKIGANAFGGLKGITSVVLPDSLRVIGASAFADTAVSSLTFGENSRLTDLGDYAFSNTKLKEVHLRTEVLARYGASPFYGTDVTAIFIYTFNGRAPEFAGKGSLQLLRQEVKYFVPAAGVEDYRTAWNLEDWFGRETALRIYPMEDVAEDSITHERYAFRILDDGTACVTHLFDRSERAVIPKQINFNGQSYTVTMVSDYVTCREVRSVDLPASLTTIGDLAFSGCTQLRSVRIDGREDPKNRWDNVESIGQYAFYRTAITHYTSGKNLKGIAAYAFYICTSLEYVELENGMGCEGNTLTSDLPDGVRIGYGAFSNALKLKRVVIGKPVSHIEYAAFTGATELTSVTIDKNAMLYVTKDALLGAKRVFDADEASLKRITFYLPSQSTINLYRETENRFNQSAGYGTANWKLYTFKLIA